MSLNFVEIGEQCSQHFFSINTDNEVVLDGSLKLKIISSQKDENVVTITTDRLSGSFGEHMGVDLNYFFLVLMVDITSTTGDILFGSKIVYGYNKENSHIDLLNQALITNNLYSQFKERFDIAYGEEMGILPVFLNHMFNNSQLSYEETSKKLEELSTISYPLKKMCTPLEKCEFNLKHNWMIVRNTEKEPGFLEHILTAILESKNQQAFTFYEKTQTDLTKFEKIDVFVVINSDETVCYEVPSSAYCITCPDAFYQSSRRLLRNLPKVLAWAQEKQIPDRTISIKDLNLEGSEGGCGSGGGSCGKEGGCCKDNGGSCGSSDKEEMIFDETKPKSTEVLFEMPKSEASEKATKEYETYFTSTSGGSPQGTSCCQGKTSGCCKAPDATVEDKSKCGTGNCKGSCKN
jgi:hypothetical protein